MQTWFIFDRGKIVWKKKKRSSSPLARYTVRRLDGRAICTWNVEVSLIFMTGGGGQIPQSYKNRESPAYIYMFRYFFWYNNSTRVFP